jgi:hypothetical protein
LACAYYGEEFNNLIFINSTNSLNWCDMNEGP